MQITPIPQPTEEQLLAAANALTPYVRYVYLLRDIESWDERFPPEKVVDFQVWLTAELKKVPEEHRGAVKIEWLIEENTLAMNLYYERLETDEEFAARVRARADETIRKETQELRQYEELRKKFEPQQKA